MSKYRVHDIVTVAASVFGEQRKDLLGVKKYPNRIEARQAVMLVAREQGWSYPHIGGVVNRDHATVMHGVKSARKRVAENYFYRERVERMKDALERGEVRGLKELAQGKPRPPIKFRPGVIIDQLAREEQLRKMTVATLEEPPPLCSEDWWLWNDIRFSRAMAAELSRREAERQAAGAA